MVRKLAPFPQHLRVWLHPSLITHDVGGALGAPRTFCEEQESLATHGGSVNWLQRTQQGGDNLIAAIVSEERGLGSPIWARWMGVGPHQAGTAAGFALRQAGKPDIACYQGV